MEEPHTFTQLYLTATNSHASNEQREIIEERTKNHQSSGYGKQYQIIELKRLVSVN